MKGKVSFAESRQTCKRRLAFFVAIRVLRLRAVTRVCTKARLSVERHVELLSHQLTMEEERIVRLSAGNEPLHRASLTMERQLRHVT